MASEGGSLGQGFTYSIYFMLSVVLFVVPALFGFLFWSSYRSNRARRKEGQGYEPPAGRQRWVEDEK